MIELIDDAWDSRRLGADEVYAAVAQDVPNLNVLLDGRLYSSMFGSRLFGTQTPVSDVDWKHVVLPPLNDLLTLKSIENKVKKTNNQKNTRNGVDDVDEEFIPVQVFAKHFVQGQTYALELAFSINGTHAHQQVHDPRFVPFVHELREKFLTSNIKAMMGYVVNQASLYSFKGERLNATRELRALFLGSLIHLDETDSTEDFAVGYQEEISALAEKYPKYFRRDVYDIGGGRLKPTFMILEKRLPFTNSVQHSLKVLSSLESKYGARADQASESNVDWKATMHALRIVDEGIELLTNKKLSFPFNPDYVAKLLSIKRGERSLAPIKDELSRKLDLLKDLEKITDLPFCDAALMESVNEWLGGWMQKFYNLK